MFQRTGLRGSVIGVTGPPGAGKSTLVDRPDGRRSRRRGKSASASLRSIPSSPFTGGALLGDRRRMQTHASDDGGLHSQHGDARGHLGGTRAGNRGMRFSCWTPQATTSSWSRPLVSGKTRWEIVRVADIALVVLVPGAGDEVQALKAGTWRLRISSS